jgi:ribose 1,5-bisphosphokinase PhnN
VGTTETLATPSELPPETGALLERSAFTVALLGPSGTGKSAVAEELHHQGLADVNATLATRPLRATESAATLDHEFITPGELTERTNSGGVLLTLPYYGFDYGVPYLRQPPLGRVALMVLKTKFIKDFKAHYPHTRIYQIEAWPERAYERMHQRGHDSTSDIMDRMRQYGRELDAGRLIAHHIFSNNGQLAHTVKRVAAQLRLDLALHDAKAFK